MYSIALRISWLLVSVLHIVTAIVPEPGVDGKYTISAPGIRAQFIPYAATLTNLFVKDKIGIERDIVLGYDNASYYPTDPNHPDYNAVPGRYANRIKNGTFVLDGKTYHTPINDGFSTLHSGPNGWSHRFFNTTDLTKSSITFSMNDSSNSTGMPGRVLANITYSLSPNAWNIHMEAVSPDTRTPIMLTQHTYWNLDAFTDPRTNKIYNHTLHLPHSDRLLKPDANMVPTGEIVDIPRYDINDFHTSAKKIGANVTSAQWVGNCGTGSGCGGYNNLWIVDGATEDIAATLASEYTGIKVDIKSNQAGIVVYTCYWMNGQVQLKKTQANGKGGVVESDGCIALEMQDWSAGINYPEWGREKAQIFGPGDRYVWDSTYTFGLI